METYDDEYGPGEHDLLGWPTLTPTRIEGGEATNQVPGECTITFDRRSVPPESVDEFVAQLEEHLYALLPRGMGLSVSLARPEMPHPEAFATAEDAPVVGELQEASGGEVRPFGAATEASYFAQHAPTVVFGPGVLVDEEGPVAHADREYVDRTEVPEAARAVRSAVRSLLG
jgi:acetylornithine deacetylase/succinyl-diaminopimelate desuccinylase